MTLTMRDPWFKPVYAGRKGPANWKGWLVMLSFIAAITGVSVATFGIALGRKADWAEFIGWAIGIATLVGFYEIVVHHTSSHN